MDIVLLKLGGSLITEKSRAETPRPEVIARLAGEIARAARETPVRLVAGHGSGSFGHVAARDSGIAGGLRSPDQLPGVSRTQERAAALHRLVIQALEEAGALPFSLAPSSCMVAAGGRVAAFHDEPLLLALERGLLPVLYGDVVLDRERGVSICSTETVLDAVARRLLEKGHVVRKALWLGETDGLYDAEGRTISKVSADDVLNAVGDPSGADVTGGMRHRIESALELARLGVPSVLINGLRAGELERALRGEAVQGTEVI